MSGLPHVLAVERVEGDPDDPGRVLVHGTIEPTTIAVDVARLLVDLGSEQALVALRLTTGDR
jgi:hypothetical protein